MSAQAAERKEVASICICSPHADHRHEHRDQRRGAEQNQCCYPVRRENRQHDQQWNADCQRHLRQIAGVVVVHIVDLLKDQRRPASGRFTLNPGGTRVLEPVHDLTADFIANLLSRVKAHAFAQPDHPGAQHKDQHQHDKGQ
ncbi:hypothetical protein D3C71_1292660 [compost metagenome]